MSSLRPARARLPNPLDYLRRGARASGRDSIRIEHTFDGDGYWGGSVGGSERRPGGLGEPVVACAGVLRGGPGPRSAAVLAAWSCRPGQGPDSPVGPLAEVVDVAMAGRRLEGWALWCQLSALARLLVAWSGRPPLGEASRSGCQGQDPALARRLGDVAGDEQAMCRRLALSEEQLAPAYVAAEVALSCGWSQSAAAQRVAAARALLVQARHCRVAALVHGGFWTGPRSICWSPGWVRSRPWSPSASRRS